MPSITALTYLAVCGVATLAAVASTPFWGILLYELNYFVAPPSRWWYGEIPDLRYSLLPMLLVLVGYFMRRPDFAPNRLSNVPQLKWLAFLVAVMLVSYFWAVSPETQADFCWRYFKIILFAVMAYKLVDTQEKMEALLSVYLLGSFYLSFLAWQSGRTQAGRLEGIGSSDTTDANGAAAVVVTAVPILAFYLLFGKKLWVRALALVGCAFVLNSLILFNSRGSFLALLCGGVYFISYLFREKAGQAFKMKAICGVAIAIALFIYLADDTFWSRMMTIAPQDESSHSVSRTQFWMMTFDMLKSHPLGAGAHGFHLLSPYYLPAEWLTRGQRAVHSIWFEVLSEYGYHGLFLFLGYITSSFLLLRRVRRHLRLADAGYLIFQSIALETALLCLLVAVSFINFFYGELIYWLPMYIAAFANIHLFRAKAEAVA